MGGGSSKEKVEYDPNRLPTVLERTLVNVVARTKFEEHLEGGEGELLLLIFKPLLYFEIAAIKNQRSARAMGEIFLKLYILPHKDKLYSGQHKKIFEEFIEAGNISAYNFNKLKMELDNAISLNYLIPYRKEVGDQLGDENQVYQELDIAANYEQVLSTTLKRENKK